MAKRVICEQNVEVPMRDGVVLRADVYRPDTQEPQPVLLLRTPYDKTYEKTQFSLDAARRGYVVIEQDTRGLWASDGDDYPYIHEKNDGYDTIEWAAHQPWSNGKVGMFGASYVGYTQFAAAVAHHPALKTIVPLFSFPDVYSSVHHGGALTLGTTVFWQLTQYAWIGALKSPDRQAEMQKWIAAMDGMSQGSTFSHLPIRDMPMLGRDAYNSSYTDLMDHPDYDAYWQAVNCPLDQIRIPVLQVGGWYDVFARYTSHSYAGIHAAGNPNQHLLIGPWVHINMENHRVGSVGEVDFGVQARDLLVQSAEIQMRWFDFWLKGMNNGVLDEPPVRIFVMGDNRWRNENEWPLARTQYTRYYLHSNGSANTLSGDGVLTTEPPAAEPADKFEYDPSNPAPTRGGELLGQSMPMLPGQYDQRSVEARPDVLVYTSSVLLKDVELTGPLEVHIWASTSATDTDFTAKLVDVGPDGYARNLADGIVRARYRNSLAQPELIRPSQVYEYIIDVSVTSNVFKAGHRILLEVSSSNFPHFDANPNTGNPLWGDWETCIAHQVILHDAEHPSYVVLPIIPP